MREEWKEPEDAEVADSRSRGPVVGGIPSEDGRRWNGKNRWQMSFGKEKGHPFLSERRGREG